MKRWFRCNKGFSIVEMLIVLSIIGLLVGVVIASTGAARSKARDEKRLGDLREIQLGLALYHDVNRGYPAGADISALNILIAQKYLPEIPNDPTGVSYEYMVTGSRYCLGTTLEGTPPDDTATCSSAPTGSTANYKVSR